MKSHRKWMPFFTFTLMSDLRTLQEFARQFDGEFHFDSLHKNLYATDASVYRKIPQAVAYPKSIADIQKLVQFAQEHETSLVARTAGTSLAGQCVGEGIIVDVSRYFINIIALDVQKKTVTVQPGVIRDELNQYLKPYGLFFGPNTSTSNRCMIGGMVGNNSSGTTSIRYGVTRDKVLEIEAVLSNGEVAVFNTINKDSFLKKIDEDTFEGQIYRSINSELSKTEVQEAIRTEFPKPEIHRRNTGYALDALLETEVFSETDAPINLCALLAGSEGTLAITTEVTLQLDDLPPEHTAMVVTHYKTLENCMNDVVVAMKHRLYACELMDKVILNCTRNNTKYDSYRFFVDGDPEALLLLELRSDTIDDLDYQVDSLLKTLETSGLSYHRPVLKGDEIDMAMELRKAGLGLLGNMVGDRKAVACIEDTAVALDDLPDFIMEFSRLMAGYGQEAVYYAHAGAGEIHLRPILNLKKEEDVVFFRKITSEVAELTKKYQGSFSGEHGDGIVRAEFIPFMIGETNYEVLRKIKAAFDPKGILNPGKIVDAWKMDESLRYQPEREEPEVETLMDFSDSQGILRLAESCNGSGDCRKSHTANGAMCPSYHVTKKEKDTTRARANALREVLTKGKTINKFDSKELKEVLDLCLSCKACASECPSNVDMAVIKAEFEHQYRKKHGASLSERLFARSSETHKKASKSPGLVNLINRGWLTSGIVKHITGISPNRTIPKYSSKTFNKYLQSEQNQIVNNERKVVLFVDEFSNYLDTEVAIDCYELLIALGYDVSVVHDLDSARALISKGFLNEAKRVADANILSLHKLVSSEIPLVGIEPSAILSFRDEYLRLADRKDLAEKIADNTFLIEEFLASEMASGTISAAQFTSEEKQIKIHVHCHQKALSNQKVTFDLLNLPKNYKPTLIPSGCCGMAGSFGYEKNHYELSMQIGELVLFPAVRKSDNNTIIAANGTSCRHQITDGTQREALHPVTILRRALLSNSQ